MVNHFVRNLHCLLLTDTLVYEIIEQDKFRAMEAFREKKPYRYSNFRIPIESTTLQSKPCFLFHV